MQPFYSQGKCRVIDSPFPYNSHIVKKITKVLERWYNYNDDWKHNIKVTKVLVIEGTW